MVDELLKRVDISLLYPPFVDKIKCALGNLHAEGKFFWAISGFRSEIEQLALWKKGRGQTGAVVDPAKVVTRVKFSFHQIGLAIDFVRDAETDTAGLQPDWSVEHYEPLAKESEAWGLESGYRWHGFQDPGHVQIKGYVLYDLKKIYDAGGVPAVWEHISSKGMVDQNGAD